MDFYHLRGLDAYQQACDQAKANPSAFWEAIASQHFQWQKPWRQVVDFDFSTASFRWFDGAQLNITENCIDRHLVDKAQQTALLFEPNDPNEGSQAISYKQLHAEVCKMANVLKSQGVKKGDRVCLYMPMILELAYAVLACARIGAIHSVVFAGFSASALASRINDCGSELLITADGGFRGSKVLDLKSIVDEALTDCPKVSTVLVAKRTNNPITMQPERDLWLAELIEQADSNCPAEPMEAEDPLFILYTSGSTGQPKGMVHSCAGYMVYTAYSFKNVFQYTSGDVYWCTADIGWITGHSYIVYGPLANGATTVMFEGVPSYPDYDRFWQIIEKHGVNQFYTAPTAIRALAKHGGGIDQYDLSSLKVLGTVGEPINEEAWQWYFNKVGGGRCPIVDTWWQTETGGIMISTLAGITDYKPTFATQPLPGIQPALMDDQGPVKGNPAKGKLCFTYPWPSMARTIWGNHQRYIDTYFSDFDQAYFSGDGALRDEQGHYRITGRVDDVVIVSGHNLGTAEIEDAINTHDEIAECAIVGVAHEIKGQALYGFITVAKDAQLDAGEVQQEINQLITERVGAIAKLEWIQLVTDLPKTRSGKIMRRILRKIAEGQRDDFGDV
ncbi:MAG: acetate--CoA ligase, partial [Pseudomonadota bacterium]|nr:acetate--CoA ligase [Pseudomonadota bacterium]